MKIYVLFYQELDSAEVAWVGVDEREALQQLADSSNAFTIQVWENNRKLTEYRSVIATLKFAEPI